MNFSELFKQSSNLCHFSPDGNYLANVVQYRVIVRDVKTLQIQNLYTCLDAISNIEWSSDSQFILCGMYKRGLVQVLSVEQPDWACKIDEGSAGLIAARWSPDGRHILTTAEFHLRITVWSLITKSVSYIKYPKDCQKGMDFTENGKYLALAERRDCKDFISVFACDTWSLVKHFDPDTENLDGLQWAPDGTSICVWESCLQYKVQLYCMDGQCLATYRTNDMMLGIKSIAWSPSGQFLAIGSYDQKATLLNHLTWRTIVEYSHPASLTPSDVIVYQEIIRKPPIQPGEAELPPSFCSQQSKYEVQTGTVQLRTLKPDLDKANPKLGIGMMAFSHDNRYMYTRNDNMPTCLWIWDIQKLKLAVVLMQDSAIRGVSWDPHQSRLALCTANNRVYMWSPAGCLSVKVPTEETFNVHHLKWHPDGNALLLMGGNQMCVCYISGEKGAEEDSQS